MVKYFIIMKELLLNTTLLNKYMVNIIYDYVVADIDKLISITQPYRSQHYITLKISPFLPYGRWDRDIIVKSIQQGYKGVSIPKMYYDSWDIDETLDNRLCVYNGENENEDDEDGEDDLYLISLKNDERDLYSCSIFNIIEQKDIFNYEITIKKNN
jgi:hypothetical protein